jgi:hypothetical protein
MRKQQRLDAQLKQKDVFGLSKQSLPKHKLEGKGDNGKEEGSV